MNFLKKLILPILTLFLLLSISKGTIVTAQAPEPAATGEATATAEPTQAATAEATAEPTQAATAEPTQAATAEPTQAATTEATAEPTQAATTEATAEPTQAATTEATAEPTLEATVTPTLTATTEITPALSVASDVHTSAATSKSLSTNFTAVNFSTTQSAAVVASYLLSTGAAWPGVGGPNTLTSFVLGPGKQQVFAQYNDPSMQSGSGSVVLQSDQQLGAVVQIQARSPQVATFAAYSGASQPSTTDYIPLVTKQLTTATGVANTQIVIQNTGTSAINVNVTFVTPSNPSVFTKLISNIPASSSFTYDLTTESDANLPVGFVGSAIVTAQGSGKIVVVSNIFFGADGLQTSNSFPLESLGQQWVVPLFPIRLANGLSASVTVQNLSGSAIAASAIQLSCTRAAGITVGSATFSVSNPAAVNNNASQAFNPVADFALFPASLTGWSGSCRVTAPGNVVVLVQLRQVGTSNVAGYEGMNTNSTDKKVIVPLVSKQLANSFATVTTVQNLSASQATNISVTYTPSDAYIASGGSATPITTPAVNVLGNGNLILNFRVAGNIPGGVSQLPAGWSGSAVITSDTTPINGFSQLTIINATPGDTLQAHNLFTQP